ncbi:PREDICTED: calmodulin-like [Branchiostoma belcheri]|uniref:Calmodulin-like n=1 Tax=Branchiostoma belcheri TaxID=7741 RepID=A0A6P4ZKZ3_BRABE|nr:PREDICTED: calmodulin-like [Branchiostoma belcheri]
MAAGDQLFDILGGSEEVQITRDELKATLKEMGHNLPDDKIEEAMKILDKDNTGSINFSQFMEFCETHLPSEQGYDGGDITNNPDKMEEQLREVFQAFDTSGDGTISKAELAKALTQAGKQPPNQQMIDVVFARIDKDGKGSLDFNEFVAFIMSMPPPVDALRQAFEQMDTDGSGNLEKDELKKLLEMAGAGPMPDDALEDVITQIGGPDRKVSFDEFCKFISPQQQQA